MYTFIGQECTFLLYKGVHSCTSKVYTFITPDYQQISNTFFFQYTNPEVFFFSPNNQVFSQRFTYTLTTAQPVPITAPAITSDG